MQTQDKNTKGHLNIFPFSVLCCHPFLLLFWHVREVKGDNREKKTYIFKTNLAMGDLCTSKMICINVDVGCVYVWYICVYVYICVSSNFD